MSLDPGAVRAAYGSGASAWSAAPAAIYRTMAVPLVERCPIPPAGALILDFGAGSGATSDVLRAAGGRVVATDLAPDMLMVDRETRPPAAAADVRALPFPSAAFDLAAGAFVISHVPQPAAGLSEVARTVRPGGAVLTVGFSGGWDHPAKVAIEETAVRYGFVRPDWYVTFKRDVDVLTNAPNRLEAVAREAGLVDVTVAEVAVDTGVRDPESIIAWRVGYPAMVPFVAGLDGWTRAEFLAALRDAVGDDPVPVVPELLVLSGRVP